MELYDAELIGYKRCKIPCFVFIFKLSYVEFEDLTAVVLGYNTM
jgi:hypothetical protein